MKLLRLKMTSALSQAPWIVAFVWTLYLAVAWLSDWRIPTTLWQRVSWDEYQFLPHIHSLQQCLLRGDLVGFFSRPEPFGYGDLFWQIYSVAALPWAGYMETDNPSPLLALRFVTLGFHLASLRLGIMLVHALGQGRTAPASAAFCMLLCFMPGLMLLYKPFSPDYLATFLVLLALLLATRAAASQGSHPLVLTIFASLTMGVALATKAYNVFLLPLFVVALFGFKLPEPRRWPVALIAGIFGAAGLVLANSSIISTGLGSWLAKYQRLSDLMNSDNHPHVIRPPGFINRLAAWWNNPNSTDLIGINTTGISREFFSPIGSGLLVLICLFFLIRRLRSRAQQTEWLPATAFVVVGAVAILLTMATTNRVWTWYLLCPVFVVTVGLSLLLSMELQSRLGKILYVTALTAHLLVLAPECGAKIRSFLRARESQIQEFQNYYTNVVKLYRPLVQRLPPRAVLAQFRAPIEPVSTRLMWSAELRGFVTPETRFISVRAVSSSDREHFLGLGFTERTYPEDYSVFLGPGLEHPSR